MFANLLTRKCTIYVVDEKQGAFIAPVDTLGAPYEVRCAIYGSSQNSSQYPRQEVQESDITLIMLDDSNIQVKRIVEFEGKTYKILTIKKVRPYAQTFNQGVIVGLVKYGKE